MPTPTVVTGDQIDLMRAIADWQRRDLETLPTTVDEAIAKLGILADTERRGLVAATILECLRLIAAEIVRAKYADIIEGAETTGAPRQITGGAIEGAA